MYNLERRLRLYFNSTSSIGLINSQNEEIEKNNLAILEEIKKTKELYNFNPNSFSSYIFSLEKEFFKNKKKIFKNIIKIKNIEFNNFKINSILNKLTENERAFLILRYKENKSMTYIATTFFYTSTSNAYRKKETILNKVSTLLYF